MYTIDLIFGPQKTKGDLREKVGEYATAIWKAGQTYGFSIINADGGRVRVTAEGPSGQAFQVRHHSAWGRRLRRELSALCRRQPVLRYTGRAEKIPRLAAGEELYLFTHFLDDTSPVRAAKTGLPIPLFRLPLNDEVKEDLVCWQREYHLCDELAILCSPLEIPAYRQLADIRSGLCQTGRRVAREVERATARRTFFYAHRYWGRRIGEQQRLCPGCGKRWYVGSSGRRGMAWFDFRCVSCRLVSHLGWTQDDERHARIGEHRVPRRRQASRSR